MEIYQHYDKLLCKSENKIELCMKLSPSNWNYIKLCQKDNMLELYNYLKEASVYRHSFDYVIEDSIKTTYNFRPDVMNEIRVVKSSENDDKIFNFINKSYFQYVQELDMFYNFSKEFLVDNLTMPDFIDADFKVPSSNYSLLGDRQILTSHDMMGGYKEDNTIEVKTPGKGYNYRMLHFMSCSIFNYFSHHFITIPPLSYIKIAHDLGNKVLGTIIIEQPELYDSLIKEIDNVETPFVDKLVNILKEKGFDGYLLNFESR